jgi:kynureninase
LIQHPEIAVLWIEGVNYLTGQRLALEELSKLAHQQDVILGVDLAHAIGNVPLRLHEWQIDCAVWCNYKYLNGGPGSVGGAFIHQKHHGADLPRLGGWWGNDPAIRFESFQDPAFKPLASADGWQLSNPSIFSCAPLLGALSIFDEIGPVGLEALYEKNKQLAHYLATLIEARLSCYGLEIITPMEKDTHGAQVSIRIKKRSLFTQIHQFLHEEEIAIFDLRQPDMMRVAPVGLYNTFTDVWMFVDRLAAYIEAHS